MARILRVAAVQMKPVMGDLAHNLQSAERLVREAAARGASVIVLPEFFPSAMAFHPAMVGAVQPLDGEPARLLQTLARQTGATVGGSFLAWRHGDVFNTFLLASPDGGTYTHDKDHPTYVENCYYRGGDDTGVAECGGLRFGIALCWEFIRTQTAARLLDRVDLVIGGSCWWQRTDRNGADNLAMLRAVPSNFARLLGVPVVHASHVGPFQGGTVRAPDAMPRPFHYLGEAQIVDGCGNVMARLAAGDGEGVAVADIAAEAVASKRPPLPHRFWIPSMPEGWDNAWRSSLQRDHEYYLAHTRPRLLARFGPDV